MAGEIPPLIVRLGAEIDDFKKDMDAALKKVESVTDGMKDLGKAMSKYVSAPLAILGGLAVKSFSEAEDAANDLAASLFNTGDATTENISKFRDYAATIQQLTKFDDDLVTSTMAMGHNMGIQTGQLEMATTAAVGLSAAYKMDLQTAMTLVAKASQGQTSALSRYGIVLGENLSPQEKFNQLLGIGASKFGLAQAQTQTLTGALAQTKNSISDLLEIVGAKLAPIIIMGANAIKQMAERLQGASPFVISLAIGIGVLVAAIGPALIITAKMITAYTTLKGVLTAARVAALGTAAGVLFLAGVALIVVANWEKTTTLLKSYFLGIATVWTTAVAKIVQGIAFLTSKIPFVGEGWALLAQQANELAETVGVKFTQMGMAVNNGGGWIENTGTMVKNAMQVMLDSAGLTGDGFENMLKRIIAAGTGTQTTLTTQLGFFKQWGANMAKSADTFAGQIDSSFSNAMAGIVLGIAEMNGDGQRMFLDFLKKMLEQTVIFAITEMAIFKSLATAMAAAFANPFVAIGVIAALAVAVHMVGENYKSRQPMADGGIATQATDVTMGEAGPEAIIPLSSPSAGRYLGGQAGGGETTIIVELDGRVIAQSTVDHLPETLRLQGIGT